MPEPTNQPTGTTTLLRHDQKFLPNVSTKTAPLRLLEKDTIWFFEKFQRDPFQDLKETITQKPTIKYFDPKLPIKVSFAASTQGFRALLGKLHGNEWHPIAYARHQQKKKYCPLEL